MPTTYSINYYNKNRDNIIKYGTTKFGCEICDREICRNSMKHHQTTERCALRK